ncbi:G patch domain-containing protein 1 [Blattella germanica]|nr:G patch domain-containing protein 1 [Blattella germanica]
MSVDSEDEDFAEYGNPLEPLDEESLPRKKIPSVRDQIATDKHGRHRFHGAFTGGFSAGFFNSVGSLEGWAPSSFKSSRSDKAKATKQTPEDFMDDEDMDEFGIAPKVLRATNDFNDSDLKRKRSHHLSDGPIPGVPILNEILQPARETVGIRLLMKMGWKPGQGVGPRVSKIEKRRMKAENKKSSTKIYGCSLPQDIDNAKSDTECKSSSDDENYEDITFAPEDFQPVLCKPKDNWFGLGYSGLDRRPVLSGHISLFEPTPLKMVENKKKVLIAGQAFGVGAFEEDDEDIYSREDMSQYDFSLESTSTASKLKNQKSRFDTLPNFAGDILEGFILGKSSDSFKKHFPPPLLPKEFQPVHISRKSRFEPVPSLNDANKKGLQRHNITAIDRAAILEEPVSTSVPHKTAKTETKEDCSVQTTKITEKLAPNQGYSNFRPFVADPEKEKRYEKFMELSRKGEKDRLSYFQPITMIEWEKEREKVEFEQAARLYQPLTGLMSDRFVSASQPEDLNIPLPPLSKPVDKDSEKRAAAKMKMAGDSSNVTNKRSKFSVFDFLDAATHNKSAANVPNIDNIQEIEGDSATTDVTVKIEVEDEEKEEEEEEEELKVEEKEVQVVNEIPKDKKTEDSVLEFPDPPNKVDLFKAIFLSSSEDSDSEEEEEKGTENMSSATNKPDLQPNNTAQEDNTVLPVISEPIIENTKRNLSPPRGVFANLDLDAINTRRKEKSKDVLQSSNQVSSVSDGNQVKSNGKIMNVEERKEETSNERMYGPTLPATPSSVVKNSSTAEIALPSVVAPTNCEWVEKTEKRHQKEKHKKHKKTSKHKKHKSKSKHKKKKR